MAEQIDTVQGKFWVHADIVGAALRSQQFWDQQIQPILDEADPTGWGIDVGANIGWFTVYMAKRMAGVLAFEAHPTNCDLLRRNLNEHRCSNVLAWTLAAFDHRTSMTLASTEVVGWNIPDPATLDGCMHPASIVFVEATPADEFRVRAVPGDHVVPSEMYVSMIKVDAQGCDLKVLQGLRQTIERCRPLIVFEYEGVSAHLFNQPLEAYKAFFAELHYSVDQIREDLWDFVARPL